MSKLVTARKGYKKATKNILPINSGLQNIPDKNIFQTAGSIDEKSSFNGAEGANKTNLWSKGLNAGIGALANPVGDLLGNAIAGGYEGAGTAVGKIGGTVGSAVGAINPIAGAIISVGSKVLGGLGNRAFGIKTNQAALKAAKNSIAQLGNYKASFGSVDDVKGLQSVANFQNPFKGGWFRSAASKNQELKDQFIEKKDFAGRSLDNGVYNLGNDMLNNALARQVAFGGPIDVVDPSTPIGYSIYTDKYMKKNDNNGLTNMFAGMPNSIFAFGGNTQTHGSTFSSGLTHIDKGGSHEENFEQGVQMGVDNQGTPNLVEEGEVIYDDYVFSNRLTVPKHKYAKGGKLKKGEELPYEQKILKPYEGLTFADAAKKIEKKSGIVDRPNDPIAIRGFEAGLGVLYTSQEREREKEKLREMQEAIDNMTPEELQALQQQMAMAQQQSEQQAMAEQQQQMVPEGMEYMQQPMEQYQPIAALGGILNTSDKKLFYDGGWTDYQKELKKYGITPEQYIEYLNRVNTSDTPITLETIGDDNFGKNDVADEVLNRINTITKQYNRRAKQQKINPEALTGRAKAQYNRELQQAIISGITYPDYNVKQDKLLTFNSATIDNARNKGEAYAEAASFNNMLASGAKEVELDDQGKVKWQSIPGLTKIDNTEEGFYSNLADLDDEGLASRGIYDYKKGTPSSISDYNNLRLYGWKKDEDGNYTLNEDYYSPDVTSEQQGNTSSTYKISPFGDLQPDAEGYKEALQKLQGTQKYIDFTKTINDAINNAKGKFEDLSPDIQNYLRYLDAHTGNIEDNLLTYADDGKITGINPEASNIYSRRRDDDKFGLYHYSIMDATGPTASRFYYEDPTSKEKIYINRPDDGVFTYDKDNPLSQPIGDITYNDYKVTGLNKDRILTRLPNGQVLDITDLDDIDSWKLLDKPVLQDNTDNLGFGVIGNTKWADYSTNPNTKYDDYNPFPEIPVGPYLGAAGLQAGMLAYNLLNPADYTHAETIEKAGSNTIPMYISSDYRPTYMKPHKFDMWAQRNRNAANLNSAINTFGNSVNPNANANVQLALYNALNADGQLGIDADKYNREDDFKVAAHNSEQNKNLAQFDMQAKLANQNAYMDASKIGVQSAIEANRMKQAIDDAKSTAISNNISGLTNLWLAYAQNKDSNNLMRWSMKTGQYGPGIYFAKDFKQQAGRAKGGKINRKKGLRF